MWYQVCNGMMKDALVFIIHCSALQVPKVMIVGNIEEGEK